MGNGHPIARRAASCAIALALGLGAPVTLSGCGGGSSSSNTNTVEISQTSYLIELGAVNNMCNGALKLAVTDIQRRPTSVFSGADINSSGTTGMDKSSDTAVSEATSTDIAIQIDLSFTWNVNTYTQALVEAGAANTSTPPKTLNDIFAPGTLMYVTGLDADGNQYMSADIISPSAQKDVNALAINAQWDYDVMNSPLPETSVTKVGSFLIRVPSTVDDLKLVITTPMGGQDVTNPSNVSGGNAFTYELPLS